MALAGRALAQSQWEQLIAVTALGTSWGIFTVSLWRIGENWVSCREKEKGWLSTSLLFFF